MSKLDIGVGDDFPLDEPQQSQEPGNDRRAWRHEHRAHRHAMRQHRRGHHHHHRGHHRGRGLGGLAFLLVAGGIVALIVEHQLTAAAAYGMIGAGVGLALAMFALRAALHWRHHRRFHQQVS